MCLLIGLETHVFSHFHLRWRRNWNPRKFNKMAVGKRDNCSGALLKKQTKFLWSVVRCFVWLFISTELIFSFPRKGKYLERRIE
jgi:hypothetical protein